MVSIKQFERVQEYIKIGLAECSQLWRLEAGNFAKATILTNVKNDMRIAQEEIIDPILSTIPYGTEGEASEIANDTSYGLAAYISSLDVEHD